MKRFVYVEARSVFVPMVEGLLVSFDSVIVDAADEDTAYRMGELLLSRMQATEIAAGDMDVASHCAGSRLNDYVVEIPD